MSSLVRQRSRGCDGPSVWRFLVTTGACLAALVVAPLSGVRAQQPGGDVVAGTVVAEGTLAPLPGVQVNVTGTPLGAATDAAGRFRIRGVSGTTVQLAVRRIGYRPTTVAARVGDQTVRIVLLEQAASLEGVVVTGTAAPTQKRALGNAISTINAAAVTQEAPISSVQGLLNGRAPGVVVMPTSGAVGTGSQIRVRGVASFSLGNNPLIYVDGVRVDNAVGAGPVNQAFGSSSISRINDIDPNEIQSIEILKGPSAATLYGTEASNGVINIITKRGTTGAPRWTASLRQGMNYFKDWESRFPTNYGPAPGTGQIVALSLDSLIKANHGDLFRKGRDQAAEIGVSGGSNLFTYYASGGVTDSKGAEPSNSLRKYSTRANLSVVPSSQLKINVNAGYVTGPTRLSAEAGYGGRLWTSLFGTPKTYGTYKNGFFSTLPYRYDLIYHMWQDLDRFTGSAQVEHKLGSWFQHRLTYGLDRVDEGNNYYWPRIDSLASDPNIGSDALGYREQDNVLKTYRTLDYAATATWAPRESMSFATSVGAQYYRATTQTLSAWGAIFPFPGLSTVNATTTGKGSGQDLYESATLGYYAQEQLSWNNRLFLTAALRQDKSSAFGANVNKVTYPKYSLSYVMSDEPWWNTVPAVGRFVNSFRVRAAYGEAGKAPGTFDALRTFAPVSGPGDNPAVTPQAIGNPNLGPERGKEYEIGFDAGALDDRLGAEVTYYHKKTTDAILFRQLAPSIGFSGQEPFNAGAILNKGWELSLRATPVRRDNFTWDVSYYLSTNDNTVTSLFPGTTWVVAGIYQRHAVGFPAFAWFERKVVSAQLDTAGKVIKSSVMCADTIPGTNGRASTSASVPCYTSSGAINPAAPSVYLGRSVPPREGSFSTTFTFFRNFRFYTQIDFKQGQRKMDGNTRVRCYFFGGRCKENFFPLQSDPTRVAQVQSNNQLINFLIANASFAKLRELTFSYQLPAGLAERFRASQATLSVSGRNLHTWTRYSGLEPEAMFLGGSRGGNAAWEQNTLPQLTSWMATLNLSF